MTGKRVVLVQRAMLLKTCLDRLLRAFFARAGKMGVVAGYLSKSAGHAIFTAISGSIRTIWKDSWGGIPGKVFYMEKVAKRTDCHCGNCPIEVYNIQPAC